VFNGGAVAEEVVEGCGQGGHSFSVSPFSPRYWSDLRVSPGGTLLSKVFDSFGLSLYFGDG
jgi:hypothetical protein